MIGIVTLFDSEVMHRAVALSRLLSPSAEPPPLVLDDRETSQMYPHLTHLHLEVNNVDEISRTLYNKFKTHQMVQGRFTSIRTQFKKWVFWEAERSHTLDHLHAAILETVKPLIKVNPVPVSWPMTPAQKEMHKTFGYPNCGSAWDPHLTLSYLRGGVKIDGLDDGITFPMPWTSKEIAVVQIGKRGTAANIIIRITFDPS